MKECSRRPEKRGVLWHADWRRDIQFPVPGQEEEPLLLVPVISAGEEETAERKVAGSGF